MDITEEKIKKMIDKQKLSNLKYRVKITQETQKGRKCPLNISNNGLMAMLKILIAVNKQCNKNELKQLTRHNKICELFESHVKLLDHCCQKKINFNEI